MSVSLLVSMVNWWYFCNRLLAAMWYFVAVIFYVLFHVCCSILNKGWHRQLRCLTKVLQLLLCAAAAVLNDLTLYSIICHVYIYCLLATQYSGKKLFMSMICRSVTAVPLQSTDIALRWMCTSYIYKPTQRLYIGYLSYVCISDWVLLQGDGTSAVCCYDMYKQIHISLPIRTCLQL